MKPPVMLATVYRRAARVIRERGWKRTGGYGDCSPRGKVTVLGAIAEASGCDQWGNHVPGLAQFWMFIGYHRDGALGWNATRRTKAQVLATLRRAEKQAAREKTRVRP